MVTEGRKGVLAWDLYAGVGLFSRALAKSFAEVVAVEGASCGGDLAGAFKGKGRTCGFGYYGGVFAGCCGAAG